MSATGLEVFDKTLQTTNIWLNQIMDRIGPDRQVAWKVLTIMLHGLRDRLPVELAAHFGAQLPLLVRGVYYERFEPARQPAECRTPDEFRAEIAEGLSDIRPVAPDEAIAAVFGLLDRHVSEGQFAKARNALPKGLKMAWDDAEARILAEAGA